MLVGHPESRPDGGSSVAFNLRAGATGSSRGGRVARGFAGGLGRLLSGALGVPVRRRRTQADSRARGRELLALPVGPQMRALAFLVLNGRRVDRGKRGYDKPCRQGLD